MLFDGTATLRDPETGLQDGELDLAATGMPPGLGLSGPLPKGAIFSSDGQQVFVAARGAASEVVRWSLSGAAEARIIWEPLPVRFGASVDGRAMVLCSSPRDGERLVYVVSGDGVVQTRRVPLKPGIITNVESVTCSGDGRFVVLGHRDGVIECLVDDGAATRIHLPGGDPVVGVTCLEPDQPIAACSGNGVFMVAADGTIERVGGVWEAGAPWTVRFDARGRLLAVGDTHGLLRVFDARTRRLLGTVKCGDRAIASLVFSASTNMLVAGSECGDTWVCRY